MLALYRVLSVLLYPFLELFVFYRAFKKKENKQRLKERFGITNLAKPEENIVWIHAVSVGETNSALNLAAQIMQDFPLCKILFTTTTLTAAEVVEKRSAQFSQRIIHQFLPIDSYYCVKSFYDFWQPKAIFFVESEIWPNMIYEAFKRDIAIILVNARLSKKSLKNWHLAKKFGLNIFDYFSAIFAQTSEDEENIKSLTKAPTYFVGNLKSQAIDLEVDEVELQKLQNQTQNRKLWLAASTHEGEEKVIFSIHQNLKKQFPDLLTIIVPRHPNRAAQISEIFVNTNYAMRSRNEEITPKTEIYLADTLGELGIFYSLANFTFIGGSLFPIGGHTPFEAIKLNCAIISGTWVANNQKIYRDLEKKSACLVAKNEEDLQQKVAMLLADENKVAQLCLKAKEVVAEENNIAAEILAKI